MANASSVISNRHYLLEYLLVILENNPTISRRRLCREYGINPVVLHRYIHRPAHLRGKNVYEEHRREIAPLVEKLYNEGNGVDKVTEMLRAKGIVCSDYLVRRILHCV